MQQYYQPNKHMKGIMLEVLVILRLQLFLALASRKSLDFGNTRFEVFEVKGN